MWTTCLQIEQSERVRKEVNTGGFYTFRQSHKCEFCSLFSYRQKGKMLFYCEIQLPVCTSIFTLSLNAAPEEAQSLSQSEAN